MANEPLRKRPAAAKSPEIPSPVRQSSVSSELEDQGRVLSIIDIIRVIITLIGASCAFSYYLTSGDSLIWNYKPWILKPGALARYIRGPIELTPSELLLYNGTAPDLPILLSINHTIFDVSASPHTYGPGGSYHVFAGRDATRAFVTGCFADDTTSDLRGAEEIYIPMDPIPGEDVELDKEEAALNSADKKIRAEKERREARKRVRKEVEKWEAFYRDHKKYLEVGRLVGVGKEAGPPPVLCDSAQKGRPRRKKQKADKNKNGNKAPGKPVD